MSDEMVDRTAEGYLVPGRKLADGRVVDVVPLTFGRSRVTVSRDETSKFIDDMW